MRKTLVALVLAVALAAPGLASADAIPYPAGGVYNPVEYTFTAAATGDLIAYIVGGFSAGFENELGLLVNGVAQGGFGLNNHTSSAGDSFNFGPVTAGDTLVFVLHNLSLGEDAFSDASLNGSYDESGDLHNHVYSTLYTATSPVFPGVPVGVYAAFEDLPFPGADFNYDDESFVFTNTVVTPSAVPAPAAVVLFGLGVAALGFVTRRRV